MRRMWLFPLILILIGSHIFTLEQKTEHFYNVDKEIKVQGTIVEIILEPRYQGTAPFLILLLEHDESKNKYYVEVSPTWFFEQDFHKGEKLSVIGSLYSGQGNSQNIIAREMQGKGKTMVLRDKRGFPNWRSGQNNRQMRKKGKRY
ncbi:MAG: hypothetical protein JW755_13775 [Candidatus Aminicenantes bacterium]|nr:hypothetical protein [Candidatus Aminicenantes bacterium]